MLASSNVLGNGVRRERHTLALVSLETPVLDTLFASLFPSVSVWIERVRVVLASCGVLVTSDSVWKETL